MYTRAKEDIKSIFGTKYYGSDHPGSYSGVGTFLKNNNVDKKQFKKWSQTQSTITLHKPRRIKFPRLKTIAIGAGKQFQIDLIDMQRYAESNNGARYILVALDVFSRFAYVETIKNKTADSVYNALEKILKKKCPRYLQSDFGSEFFNQKLKLLYKKNKITHFASYNFDIKCSLVERFIRTFKSKIFRYFYKNNTEKYDNILQSLVRSYNKSYHRSIKMTPLEAENPKKWVEVWVNDYVNLPSKGRKNKLKVGDFVRLSRYKGLFEKGYEISWSEEYFKISKIILGNPTVYKLQDLTDTAIEGRFYRQEIQKIIPQKDADFKIERVIKTSKGWAYVKFRNWPDKFNSWVRKKDLKRIG